MKDGKKATTKKAHDIYKMYISEQAPKRVNIDSDTRAAMKAALESGCRTDTFNLAQAQTSHENPLLQKVPQGPSDLNFVTQVEEAQRKPQPPGETNKEASE